MKKSILTLAIVLSFSYIFSANKLASKKTNDNNINNVVYIEEETDEPFDFDHTQYLPVGFNPYDLTSNEADATIWIEELADEPFEFNHTQYLPVGFNPNSAFNALFLEDIKWIEEEEDEPFTFDTKKYFNKIKLKMFVTDNF